MIGWWLCPAAAPNELFEKFIRILSEELEAPFFEPHLSICVTRQQAQTPPKCLPKIDIGPIRLAVRDVYYTDQFFKTLFVRFHRTPALDELSKSFRQTMNLPPEVIADPHISLLYKKLPAAMKRELAATIKLPFREVLFDSIKAVHVVLPRGLKDVESWRVVARKKLR
jgi:hypothetical protein